MRKFLSFLLASLLALALQGQTIDFVAKSASQPVGMVIVKPSNLDPGKKYPFFVFLHGTGGRGDGSLNSWGLPAMVANGELPVNLRDGAEKYGFIVVAPQIGGDWAVSDVDAAYNYAKNSLPVDLKKANLTGLSLGGGGTLRYITSSAANADKWATAIPICPVAWGTTWSNIVSAKLPVWFFHAANDGTVGVSSTNNAVTAINNLNPSIPAVKTIYKSGGHGIWDWAYDEVNLPATPASADYLNNPVVNVYQWALMNSTDSPRAVPTEIPLDPVADIGNDVEVSSRTFVVDASASKNIVPYPQVYNAYTWEVSPITGSWNNLILDPPGIYGGPKKTFKVATDGTYRVKVTALGTNGKQSSDEVVITVNASGTPPPVTKKELGRIFVDKLGKFIVVYDDGTTEIK